MGGRPDVVDDNSRHVHFSPWDILLPIQNEISSIASSSQEQPARLDLIRRTEWKTFQGRGLASAMLTAGIDRLVARGAERVRISYGSEAAAGAYQGVGLPHVHRHVVPTVGRVSGRGERALSVAPCHRPASSRGACSQADPWVGQCVARGLAKSSAGRSSAQLRASRLPDERARRSPPRRVWL